MFVKVRFIRNVWFYEFLIKFKHNTIRTNNSAYRRETDVGANYLENMRKLVFEKSLTLERCRLQFLVVQPQNASKDLVKLNFWEQWNAVKIFYMLFVGSSL